MDREMYLECSNFRLHYSALNSSKPYSMNKAIKVPDTVVINISSYLMDVDDTQYMSDKVRSILT